jgi:formate hydrogenlyase subunit 4
MMKSLIIALAYIALAPVAGALLAGIDRRITARIQRRRGPPILQSWYDVMKLFAKEPIGVRRHGDFYLAGHLVFMVAAGVEFFIGGDLLIVIFAFALSSIFLVLGAYAAHSPFSHIGAERELLLMMAAEPILLLTAMGFYLTSGSFRVDAIAVDPTPPLFALPGIFLSLAFILTIKLRKSPFDISTSHHAHQEIVKGLTTEFSGVSLAIVEIAHWYETIMFLGLFYLFLAPYPWLATLLVLVVYALEILLDNTSARMKWQWAIRSSWVTAIVLGAANIIAVFYWSGGVP